ncbi:unnamed protein product [Darwinula stevensoni]|uniref:Uncharacterized protein n=1 Tax=Darwinula stevensoni TaxID=69355 RepID=A0A7R9A5E5_9CRUS|nr:unnamed protein product [Darwinula stevensoni]CAG0885168.1 unnamed protein product [Darwinula stevensoni]
MSQIPILASWRRPIRYRVNSSAALIYLLHPALKPESLRHPEIPFGGQIQVAILFGCESFPREEDSNWMRIRIVTIYLNALADFYHNRLELMGHPVVLHFITGGNEALDMEWIPTDHKRSRDLPTSLRHSRVAIPFFIAGLPGHLRISRLRFGLTLFGI